MVFMQYGGLLAVRNRRVSILQSNPLWGPRRNLMVPVGMTLTVLIAVVNLYGPGLQRVFGTTPIPGMFWGIPLTFAVGILTVDEIRKLIVRTYPKVCISISFNRLASILIHEAVHHRTHCLVTTRGLTCFFRLPRTQRQRRLPFERYQSRVLFVHV